MTLIHFTMSDYDYLFKIVVIGDNTVGKLKVLEAIAKRRRASLVSTIGVDFVLVRVSVTDL